MDAITTIATKFNETGAVQDAQRIDLVDDPREFAANIIRRIDHRIAQTSETCLLTDALHNIHHDADLAGTFHWWMDAYAQYASILEREDDADAEDAFLEALFEGRLDFAVA